MLRVLRGRYARLSRHATAATRIHVANRKIPNRQTDGRSGSNVGLGVRVTHGIVNDATTSTRHIKALVKY